MAGLLLHVTFAGVEIPVEVAPDATVQDVKIAAALVDPAISTAQLLFSGEKLMDSVLLADAGICQQSKVEAVPALNNFNTDLPHTGCMFNDDATEVWGDFKDDTKTFLARTPIKNPGKSTFWVSILKYKGSANYFGVGLSPFPKDVQELESRRIANDSSSSKFQGNGISYNQNGCCYGGSQFGESTRALGEGDIVQVDTEWPAKTVSFTLYDKTGNQVKELKGKFLGYKAQKGEGQKQDKKEEERVATQDIYPACFLQYGKDTTLKLWTEAPPAIADKQG